MYEDFFGLQKDPFVLTPDPDFLFLTDAHRDALAALSYSILHYRGFMVLTGDAGTGKTTLLRSILESIPDDRAQFAYVFNPTLNPSEFLEMLMLDFGLEVSADSKTQRLLQLQQFLLNSHKEGRVCALIVDEAHQLSPELLEEIRLLTNFETSNAKLLQIVLAGQDELNDLLDRKELRQLKQRIAIRMHINPLAAQDVERYLRHRWFKAGAAGDLPFLPDAIQRIIAYSGGIPRTINAMCGNALLSAYAEESQLIRADHIMDVAREMHLAEASPLPAAATPPAAPALRAQRPEPAGPKPGALKVPPPVRVGGEAASMPTLERYSPNEQERTGLLGWMSKKLA